MTEKPQKKSAAPEKSNKLIWVLSAIALLGLTACGLGIFVWCSRDKEHEEKKTFIKEPKVIETEPTSAPPPVVVLPEAPAAPSASPAPSRAPPAPPAAIPEGPKPKSPSTSSRRSSLNDARIESPFTSAGSVIGHQPSPSGSVGSTSPQYRSK